MKTLRSAGFSSTALLVGHLIFTGLLSLPSPANSQTYVPNPERGKQIYQDTSTGCVQCHNANPALAGGGTSTTYPPATSSTLGRSASDLQGKFNQGTLGQMGAPSTNFLRTGSNGIRTPIHNSVADIARYLELLDFPTAEFTDTSIASTPVTRLDFSDTAAGDTRQFTIRIRNSGTNTLTITSASLSDATNYSVSSCPTVAANSFCDLTVTFRPQSAGSFNGRTLTFTHDAYGSPDVVQLFGRGIAPLSSSASSLSLQATVGGAAPATLILTNSSSGTISIGSPQLTGTNSGEYSLVSQGQFTPPVCSFPTSLNAGAQCTVQVSFTPTAAVSGRDAVLSIPYARSAVALPGSPLTISLTGTGTAASTGRLDLSPTALVFTDTDLGASRSQTISASNGGSAPLTISSTQVTGTHSGDFTANTDCTSELQPGSGNCQVSVQFSPTAATLREATLQVNYNDGSNRSQTVLLSGTGRVTPAPAVLLDPASAIDFGAQTIGGIYSSRRVELRNTGTASLTIGAISVQGSAFAIDGSPTCPSTLLASQVCEVRIRFTPPGVAASYEGSLVIVDSAPGSPRTLTLRGSGTAFQVPELVWDPAVSSLGSFGSSAVGTVTSTPLSATLRNRGPGGAELVIMNAVGTDSSMFALGTEGDTNACRLGQVLPADGTCRLDVRFAPGLNGVRTATVQVAARGSTQASSAQLALAPPLTVSGTGSGAPSAEIDVLSLLSLGTVRVGSSSAPSEVRIRSRGATLRVSEFLVTGPFAVTSLTCPPTPFSLPTGTECAITVSFVPQASGEATGTLRINSDAGNDPSRDIALSATGEAPPSVSGGGCSIAQGRTAMDPTLWLLVVMASLALTWRGVRRRQQRPRGSSGH